MFLPLIGNFLPAVGIHVDDFLPKPFSPGQLAAKVRNALVPVVEDT